MRESIPGGRALRSRPKVFPNWSNVHLEELVASIGGHVTLVEMSVATLVAVTSAPAITAPLESATVPRICP